MNRIVQHSLRSRVRGAQSLALTIGVAIVLALVAAAAGYWFGTQRSPESRGGQASAPGANAGADSSGTAAGTSGNAAGSSERKVLYWHDPMVPGQRFDQPGKSPFMDMDLVPVYADAGADEGQVSVSPRLAQSLGLRTAEAREATLDVGFSAVGSIGIDERKLVAVQARSTGYVERLFVRAQFESVAAGAPLAALYVPEWLAGEEEFLALKASRQPGAQALAEAARDRLRLLGVPDGEIARLEREGKAAARVTVTAPESGVVWEIGARDGMAVMPGTTLYRLAGIGTVWVVAEVPEAQAARVKVGAPVVVHATAYPERSYKGTVAALLPDVNAATRTVRARIVLDNPGGLLKPGMFASVAFGGAAAKPVVVVPSEAVIRTGRREVVIVDVGEGRFAPVEVTVGRETGDLTEIRQGLKAGQRVVASGQFLIDSEASLKGVLQRLSGGDAGSDADPHSGHAGPGRGKAPALPAHKAEGVVKSVGDDVLIQHGAIPSAGMGAMTMGFKAPKAGVPNDVTPGTRVRFEFVLTPQGEMQLTSIVPNAGGSSGAAK